MRRDAMDRFALWLPENKCGIRLKVDPACELIKIADERRKN